MACQTTGVQADYDAALAVYNYAHATIAPLYMKELDRYLRQ